MNSTKTFTIRVRENGDVIDTFDTIEEAKKEIQRYEAEDKAEGIYEPNFYEIAKIEKVIKTYDTEDLGTLTVMKSVDGSTFGLFDDEGALLTEGDSIAQIDAYVSCID